MGTFVTGNTPLPAQKTNAPNRNPAGLAYELDASDINNLWSAAGDLRTAVYQLGIVKSVYDYGAAGDGVSDDSVAIQAAIDSNKGGTVVIPPGTFICAGVKLTDSTYNGTKLISTGGVLKLKADGGASTFGGAWVGVLVGAADSVVLDLMFDGNRSAMTTTEHVYCVGVAGASNLTIPRLLTKEIRGDGIYIGQSNWLSSSTDPTNIAIGILAGANAAGSNDGRNLCSVISCVGLNIGALSSYNIGSSSLGGGPGAVEPGGLDFEPDHGYQTISDVNIGSVNVVTGGTSGFQILGKSVSGNDANRDWNIKRIQVGSCQVRKTGNANGSNIIRASDVTINMDTSRSDNYTAKGIQLDYLDRPKLVLRSTHCATGLDVGPVGEVRDFDISVEVSDYSVAGIQVNFASRGRFRGRVSNSISVSASSPIAVYAHGTGTTQSAVTYAIDAPYDSVATHGFQNAPGNAVTFDAACRIRDCDLSGYSTLAAAIDTATAAPFRVNVAGFASSTMPSTGNWTQGEFVPNSGAPGADALLGWLRATTGSANVLGTDWLTCSFTGNNGTGLVSLSGLVGSEGILKMGTAAGTTLELVGTSDIGRIYGSGSGGGFALITGMPGTGTGTGGLIRFVNNDTDSTNEFLMNTITGWFMALGRASFGKNADDTVNALQVYGNTSFKDSSSVEHASVNGTTGAAVFQSLTLGTTALAIASGGTGQTTAANAWAALLPTQATFTILGNATGSTAQPTALTPGGSASIRRVEENFTVSQPANAATVNPSTSTCSVYGIRCNAAVASITIDIPDDHSYDGQYLEIRLFNNSGGALTTTWTTAGTGAFLFAGGTAPTAPATGKRRYIAFRFDSNSAKYIELWRSTGDI